MDYKTTIGLEIHAELKTRTKMFCGCINNPMEAKPNVNVCPICLAHPGVLPTINEKAVEYVVKVGFALDGNIATKSNFDRKSYFYPDLPKGYQISQYEYPFVEGGKLVGVDITRVHLEEDTGKLIHGKDGSFVDFNRAGVPLMELVTEPNIKTAEEALEFAKELQLILRYLDVSDADMEKGQMRVEANISIAKEGAKELGTKVEVKNINSFKAVKNAIAYELERQEEILLRGERVIQETRGWDDKKMITVSQRKKEEANDYRYMPEPDLSPLDFNIKKIAINIDEIKLSVPELPREKRVRFAKEYGFDKSDILNRIIKDRGEADFFEKVVSEADEWMSSLNDDEKLKLEYKNGEEQKYRKEIITWIINYIDSDLVGMMLANKTSWQNLKITPENFAELAVIYKKGDISTKTAKNVLREMFETGADPSNIIKEKDLGQVVDEAKIIEIINEVISENKNAVNDYKKGKENALKFLIGQTMAKLNGRGNPKLLEKIFEKVLQKQ